MKKVLKFVYVFILLFCSNEVIKAETVDNTSANIYSISIEKTNFAAGDEIVFKINASDDVSGIESISFLFIKKEDTNTVANNFFNITFNEKYINGTKEYTGKIPKHVLTGEYKFFNVSVLDKANNDKIYSINGCDEGCVVEDFDLPILTISEYNGDLDGPVLNELLIDKNKVDAGEKVTVTAKVEDKSNIKELFIYYNNYTHAYLFTKIDENTYSATFSFNTPGTYKFDYIQLIDEHDNISVYSYNNGEEDYSWDNVDNYYSLEKNKYDLEVDGVADVEAPVLKNIIINDKKVKVPSSFYIYVEAQDNFDNDIEMNVVVSKKVCLPFESCGKAEAYYVKKENNKYVFNIVIGQYASPGTYIVSNVEMRDDVGNKAIYSVHESEYTNFTPMQDYEFEVIEDTKADITTSTDSDKMLDLINNSNDGSMISIDTTNNTVIKQNIFEAIKGTNKKINLETNGISWVFDGNNIKQSKEIDISTNIHFVNDYKNTGHWNKKKHKALVIEFKDNGKLPGKCLIRIKADYAFRNYIGIKKLNLYYMNGQDFDLISKGINLTKDGYYEFYIDHNSTYFLSNETAEEKYVVNDYSVQLGNDKLNNQAQNDNNTNNDNQNTTNNNNETLEPNNPDNGVKDDKVEDNGSDNENNSTNSDKIEDNNTDVKEDINEDNGVDIVEGKQENKKSLPLAITLISLIIVSFVFIFIKFRKK